MHRRGRLFTGCAIGVVAAVGCGTAEVPVLFTPDGGVHTFDGSNGGADGSTFPDGLQGAYCASSGPPVLLTGDGGVVCAGAVAAETFRYALCTCAGLVGSHSITTDAFDGSQGPYNPSTATVGGSVGTNGNLNVSAPMEIGGSLWAGDPSGFSTNQDADVKGELHVEGEVASGPMLSVGTDAWLAGGIVTTGDLLVTGTLYVPAGAPLNVGGTDMVGATMTGPVTVPPPCDCAASDLLNVPAFVEAYRTMNDDASAGVSPSLFENVSAPLTMTLSCGRYFFTQIASHATVSLTALGHVAIFVGGDLSADTDFVISVPTGSELILFIEGNVVAAGAFAVGDPANPALARTYVGGTGTVNLQNPAAFAGNLYAPNAQVVLGGSAPATVYGSIFASRLNAGADLTIHFDESVAQTGAGCPVTTMGCTSCRDCGGQACNAGTCGACTDSSQCCAPSVCRGGTCVLDIR